MYTFNEICVQTTAIHIGNLCKISSRCTQHFPTVALDAVYTYRVHRLRMRSPVILFTEYMYTFHHTTMSIAFTNFFENARHDFRQLLKIILSINIIDNPNH